MSSLTHSLRGPLLVGIGGGLSGGGTSPLAQALMSLLGPAQTAFLPQDAYRRDDGAPPLDVHTAGEHEPPDAFDQGLFLEHLRALRAGHPARPPASSSMARRRGGRTRTVVPRPVVVVEGTFLLWEPAVPAALDLKIYLDTPVPVWLEHRLAWHAAERGRAAGMALLQLTAAMRDAHRNYVEPTRAMADLVLSTASRVQPIAEVAAAVVLDRLARHRAHRAPIAS